MKACPKCGMVAAEWVQDEIEPDDSYYDCQNCGHTFDKENNQV